MLATLVSVGVASLPGGVFYVSQLVADQHSIGLGRLDLDSLSTTIVATARDVRTFGLQAATVENGVYTTTLSRSALINPWIPGQCDDPCANSSCCRDPNPSRHSSGYCLRVNNCSEINDGRGLGGATKRFNVTSGAEAAHYEGSLCWAIATDVARPGEILCVSDVNSGDPEVPWAQNRLLRFNLTSGVEAVVGRFPPDGVDMALLSAYDASTSTMYVGLNATATPASRGNATLFGMDTTTGRIVSAAPLPSSLTPRLLNLAAPAQGATGIGFGLALLTAPSGEAYRAFVQVDMPRAALTELGMGAAREATRRCVSAERYRVIGGATMSRAGDLFVFKAAGFPSAHGEHISHWLIALNATDGSVLLEHRIALGNATGLSPAIVGLAYDLQS